MSAGRPRYATLDVAVEIDEERRAALLSALRRGVGGAALELLDGWQPLQEDGLDPDDACGRLTFLDRRQIDLSRWTRDECHRHAAAGRFQHALALLDRYLWLPQIFSAEEEAFKATEARPMRTPP